MKIVVINASLKGSTLRAGRTGGCSACGASHGVTSLPWGDKQEICGGRAKRAVQR